MTLRHVCAGLVLLATVAATGCNCGRIFNRSASCCPPPPAVSAAPCCPDPTPVIAGPPAVQSYSVQPPY